MRRSISHKNHPIPFHPGIPGTLFRITARYVPLVPLLLALCAAPQRSLSQTIDGPYMNGRLREIRVCYSEKKDCTPLFLTLRDEIGRITNDTMASRLLVNLASIRDNAGQWDTLTEDTYRRAIERHRHTDFPCIEVIAHFSYTRFALFQDDPLETLERANEALRVAEECGKGDHVAHAHSFIGAAYLDLSSYKEALEELTIAERFYRETKDSIGLAMVMLDQSIAYSELDRQEKSMELVRQAAGIYKAAGRDLNYAVAMIDLCSEYLDANMPDSVGKYLPECMAIVEGRHAMGLAFAYERYGRYHLMKNAPAEALVQLNKALQGFKEIGDPAMIASVLTIISDCEEQLGQPENAYRSALLADSTSARFGQTKNRLATLRRLADISYATGRYSESNAAFNGFIALNDSLLGADRLAEIARLERSFEAREQADLIELHRKENALLQEKNRASRNRNVTLLVSLLLLGALAYAVINRQRLKVMAQQGQLKVKELENANLDQEIAYKNRELTAKVLHLAQKNELLGDLRDDLAALKRTSKGTPEVNDLVSKLRFDEQIDDNWEEFTLQFTATNPSFYAQLTARHADLTKNELRLAALLRMGMDNKAIASMLHVSDEGVKKARYRLRKKLGMSSEENLEAYMMTM